MSADTTMANIPAAEPQVEQPVATEAVAETTPAQTEEKKAEEKTEEKTEEKVEEKTEEEPTAASRPKAVKFDASLLPESSDPAEIRKQVCSY